MQDAVIGIVGDTHGHLQLACCVMARWQKELGARLEALFLCGDVGSFTEDSQLDSATRRHAKANPCELEFLHQWAADPQAPWLDYIFLPEDEGGLGLECPVVMVHGNHEGFAHLESLVPDEIPVQPVAIEELPAVDTNGHLRLLPSGWRTALPSGCVVAGVGGVEEGQRRAVYHRMAWLDEDAIAALCDADRADVLVTHQGPSGVQGEKGSELLQLLLEAGTAPVWFHGHARRVGTATRAGPGDRCLVVPLGDVAFPTHGLDFHDPGRDGWALATFGEGKVSVATEAPPFLREFRRHRWIPAADGQLIAPPLARIAWELARKRT